MEIPENVKRLLQNTRNLIKEIDRVAEDLREFSDWIESVELVETKEFASFTASIFKARRGKGEKIILRAEPEIEVEPELFTLLYHSELVPKRLSDTVTTEGTTYGSNIFQLTVDAPETLLDYTLEQIFIKLRKAFWAFSEPEMRQKLKELKDKLEKYREEDRSERELEILRQKINDQLFYTVQLPS